MIITRKRRNWSHQKLSLTPKSLQHLWRYCFIMPSLLLLFFLIH